MHKLLQVLIEQYYLRFLLSSDEAKRISKFKSLTDKLKREENAPNPQFLTLLSEVEYAQIETTSNQQLGFKKVLLDKISELIWFKEKLKKATLHAEKSEGFSKNGVGFANALKEVKHLCEEFKFSAGMLKG